jgi:hypothetical protein
METLFAQKNMLDLPAGLTLSIIILTITTFVAFLFAIALSSNARLQRSATLIGVVVLLWIIFQSTLSLNRWYMDRKTVNVLFPYITTFVLIVVVGFLPALKAFRVALHRPTLSWMQLLRLPIYGIMLWSVQHKQTPSGIWLYLLVFDAALMLAMPFVLRQARARVSSHWMERMWHLTGLLSLATAWMFMLLSAPSSLQQMAFQSPNYLIVHFPGSWIPSVVIPLLMFGHVIGFTHGPERSST